MKIDDILRERSEAGLLRRLRPVASRRRGVVGLDGRDYIDFSSNDYLGLSQHPCLIEAGIAAFREWGSASSASRLLSGSLEPHHRLEEKLAQFKQKEAALVFNSGYQANVGILSALCGRDDCIFSDRLNHASIVDGNLLSGAKVFRFRHNDTGHAESLIKKERANFKSALIVTETIFSMDGDRPDLKELVRLKEAYDCLLMVDEVHATGIFGEQGSGIVEEDGLTDRVDLIMGTFSKALGGFGGYVAASGRMIDYLVNTARSFIYSTALPPSVIASNSAGIDVVRAEPQRRQALRRNADFFRQALKDKGLDVRGSSQIIPVITGDALKTTAYAQELQKKGYWVMPIRPPTVPRNEARLRFSLTAYHNREILQKLADDIASLLL